MENFSGIHPVADIVLIKPMEIEKHSAGGIVLPLSLVEQKELADIHGILVELGELAKKHASTKDMKVGQMLLHAKYAGIRYRGVDGAWYRLMRSDEVMGTVDAVTDQYEYGREKQTARLDSPLVTA